METRSRLAGTRGERQGDKGGKREKGLVKEPVERAHGHREQGGD